jgi:hypothetical protein
MDYSAAQLRQLTDIDNDLERAVFMARYQSVQQRLLRTAAVLIIVARHGLRGLLYVWPLTLLVFVDFPGVWDAIRLVLLVLATAAWSRFVYGSVRDDYKRFIGDRLLVPASLRDVF